MDARVTLLNVAAAEAAGMTGFSHIIVEGAASPIAKGSSEVRQGDLLRAHLQALVNGLEALTRQSASGGRDSILLCLSHEYLRRGIEEWLPRWKANGWRNASRKPVAYADLWMMVDALLGRLRASNTGDTLVLRGDPNDNHQRLANQVAERALKIGLEVAGAIGDEAPSEECFSRPYDGCSNDAERAARDAAIAAADDGSLPWAA